jgi:hypothetical protein
MHDTALALIPIQTEPVQQFWGRRPYMSCCTCSLPLQDQ